MAAKEAYQQRLLDPRWQKLRLQIFERDDWTCQLCGSITNTLHVHHAQYSSRDPWDTPASLLFTACADCHDLEHDEYKDMLRWLMQYLGEIGIRSSLDIRFLLENVEGDLKGLAGDRTRVEMLPLEKAQAFGSALNLMALYRKLMLEDCWRSNVQA